MESSMVRMPEKKYEGTKEILLEVAGRLFAEKGLEATSIRTIAKEADVNIAAVNYHFGSKENLYASAINKVWSRGDSIEDIVAKFHSEKYKTRDGIWEMLHHVFTEKFHIFFNENYPLWHIQLVMRGMYEPTEGTRQLCKEHFGPDFKAMKSFARKANPQLSDQDAELWTISFFGKIGSYIFLREPILMVLEREDFDKDYLKMSIDYMTDISVMALYNQYNE